MSAKAAASVTPPALTPVAKAADPLFLATSIEWLMDASIPIEIRMLCQLILAHALTEAKAEGRDFTEFGRDQVTTKINVNWIIEKTGWPKNKAEAVRAEALEKGYLVASGSSRTGFRYTVTLSLRTYRGNEDVPTARSLFAADHVAPKPKPSRQLELGDVGAAAVAPPDMRRWSRADREFYSRSSGAIRLVFSPLSGANRKLFARLSGANQELYSRTPGADRDLLLRLSGANDELYSRRSAAKKGLSNVRARSQESTQTNYHNLLAETITPEIRTQLLLLARKREEDTDEDSKTFVKALGRVVETLAELCDGNREEIRNTLARVCADERVTSHDNPIALMLRGICNTPRFLLTTRYASRIGKTPDDRAYYLLPEPLQNALLDRIRSGRITPDWCRERDISLGARRAAAALVERDRLATPTNTPLTIPSEPDEPNERDVDDIVYPEWWSPVATEMQKRLSPMVFEAFFRALQPSDSEDERLVTIPLPFTLQKLNKDLGREFSHVLAEIGCTARVVVGES